MARELPIYRGGEVVAHALLDGEDWFRLSRWRWQWNPRHGTIRRVAYVGGRQTNVVLSREVVGAAPGDGTTVRHANGNRLDNRRANLRVTRVRPPRPSRDSA
jgi:hypothetical protein